MGKDWEHESQYIDGLKQIKVINFIFFRGADLFLFKWFWLISECVYIYLKSIWSYSDYVTYAIDKPLILFGVLLIIYE